MARDLLVAALMAALRLSRVNVLLLAVMMTGIGLAVLRPQEHFLYNPSASLPKGFYVRTEGELVLGVIVTIRSVDAAPEYAARRNFTDAGDRFLKRIAAMEGDTVCAEGSLIRINDVPVAERAETDPAGDPLPSWNGCVTLAGGEVFLLGDHPGSFDGRYWGVSERTDLTGPWRRVR